MKSVVAIVGRPNVGKSTLFNRLVQERRSITDPTPGVTRDRIYGEVEWTGHEFVAIDTGGWEKNVHNPTHDDDKIRRSIRRQVDAALESADACVMVVDGREGITATDQMIADILRPLDIPLVLAVNKIDHSTLFENAYNFYSLGLGDPIAISAEHGRNTGDLLDAVVDILPRRQVEPDRPGIRVAIVGRPNVGKSSLLNRLLGDDRVLVSDSPGTTRDAVEVSWHWQERHIIFVDTAGLRRKARIDEDVERYSVSRALKAVRESHVVVIMLDAQELVTEQDQRIAGYTRDQGRAAVVAVNKWDTVPSDENAWKRYLDVIEEELYFLDYAPVVSISATEGLRVERIPRYIVQVYSAYRAQVATSELNRAVREVTSRHTPPVRRGKKFKVYYATQVADGPPTFLCFVNDPALYTEQYERYLTRALRRELDLWGTPIRIIVRKSE